MKVLVSNTRPCVSRRKFGLSSNSNRITHIRRAVSPPIFFLPPTHTQEDTGEFDEGAAQVRRLVDRDRKDIKLEELENFFIDPADATTAASDTGTSARPSSSSSSPPPPPKQSSSPPPPQPAPSFNTASSPPKPASPFGSSLPLSPSLPLGGGEGKGTASPFGPSSPSSSPSMGKSPFADPPKFQEPTSRDVAAMYDGPWWKRITLTQVVIVLSFTTIILLMIGTFFVVLKMGAVRFNE